MLYITLQQKHEKIKSFLRKNPQKTDKNGPSAAPDGAMEGKRTETDPPALRTELWRASRTETDPPPLRTELWRASGRKRCVCYSQWGGLFLCSRSVLACSREPCCARRSGHVRQLNDFVYGAISLLICTRWSLRLLSVGGHWTYRDHNKKNTGVNRC